MSTPNHAAEQGRACYPLARPFPTPGPLILHAYRELGIALNGDDAARDADWLSLAPVVVDGAPDGQLADQAFRLHSNGGNPPSSVCCFG